MENKYQYLIMTQQDMLESQVLEEVLRERTNYYRVRAKICDFWILISPNFVYESPIAGKLRKSKFYTQKGKYIRDNRSSEYYAVFLSPDEDFMRWLKLRLGFFENIEGLDHDQMFISDGVYGYLDMAEKDWNIESNQYDIHPDIISRRFKSTLEAVNRLRRLTKEIE